MKSKYLRLFVTFFFSLFVSAPRTGNIAVCQSRNSSGYRLTIYADDRSTIGHVSVGISDGTSTIIKGFYPQHFELGGPGEVLDDKKRISNCEWDVRKQYEITKAGYEAADRVMKEWNKGYRAYNLAGGPHCGDFAQAVAKAAGVTVNLAFRFQDGGKNRPGLFGEYLRNHGGEHSAETYYVNTYVDTKISINRGDKISIRASGKVTFGPNVGAGGPDGIWFSSGPFLLPIDTDRYNYFPEDAHGCLMGRIAQAGQADRAGWFLIGKGGEMTAAETGVLELNVNDNKPRDNKGKFEVEIKVCKAQL